MKFTIERNEFMAGILRAAKAVPKKTALPILECFLLEARGNEIILTANDLEMGIETHMYGFVLEEGVMAVNADLLKDIVSKMPNNVIDFETNQLLNTTLRCDKCVLHIPGNGADDFTPIKRIDEPLYEFVMKQSVLKEMVRTTIFSINKGDSDMVLMKCLNLKCSGEQIQLTALDGHRIAIRYADMQDTSKIKLDVNIPGKTLGEVAKLLSDDSDAEVSISLNGNHILFKTEHTTVSSILVNGNYYKVEQMISEDWVTRINVKRMELCNAIDRATLFTKSDTKKPVRFQITGNEMSISCSGTIGSSKEDIDVVKEGKDILIAFNPYYILEVLKNINQEDIEMRFTNPKAPAFISNKEEKYMYVILPVNIGNGN